MEIEMDDAEKKTVVKSTDDPKLFSVLNFCRKFVQFVLIIVNAIVAVLGFVIFIVGIVSKINEGRVILMSTDNTDTEISSITTMLIIVGILITIIGGFGSAGAIFASTIGGRGVLLLYSVTLGVLIVFEFSGGIAASVKRNEINNEFRQGIFDSFQHIPNHDAYKDSWIEFQQSYQCCGVNNFNDWILYLNMSVPASCCKTVPCTQSQYWPNGCADSIVYWLDSNAVGIAVVALLFALLQIAGVAGSCFVVFYKNHNTYQQFI